MNRKGQEGFVKAFKHDISREADLLEDGWGARSGSTVFMNVTRQDMFVKLSERPGMGLREMARTMGVSAPTAAWHLGRLTKVDLLVMRKFGNSTRYFPNWMIAPEDQELVALLATALPRDVLNIVMSRPGINQKVIAKGVGKPHQSIIRVCDRLADAHVISRIEDGRYTRYFPSDLLSELDGKYKDRIKMFRENIVIALRSDGVNPKLIKNYPTRLVVEVTAGATRRRLRISCAPFRTILG